MKKILRLTLVLIAAMVCSMGYAQETTFDWSSVKTTTTAKEAHSYTQAPITLTFDKGTNSFGNVPSENKEGSIRMYVNTTLNIKADNGYVITKVVFTPTGNSYNATKLTYGGTALTSDEWNLPTPSQNIDLTATANARFKKIVVTYTASTGTTKANAGLAWSKNSISIEKGAAFTAPTFTKATTAAVTFSSDNEDVATVSNDGVISLGTATGKAKITATSEENDAYYAGTATVTIEVYTNNIFTKAKAIESGKKYLLVAQRNDSTMYAFPLNATTNYGYLNASVIKELTDTINVKSSYSDEFTITANGTGYNIQDANNKYYYFDDSHNTFQAGTTAPSDAWTIESQADGTFKMTYGDKYIQWGQKTYKTFGGWADAQDGAVLPYLYEFVEPSTGINNIRTNGKAEFNANAPIYNLAGQRVSKSYKGVVIQNGKKFFQK